MNRTRTPSRAIATQSLARHSLSPCLGFALALGLGASGALAQTEDSASVLIVDASGSMWGQLEDGRSKIEIAREVLTEFFSTRDASEPLGVIAYGHRRRGDCADIELIAPVARQQAGSLASRLSKISPRGMTPIAASLQLAAAQIPRSAERADIILVTDGLETCEADPCSVAAELAATGLAIRAHVVGFGLTEQQANALACVTEQTGGLLLRPQSGAELAAALDSIASAEPAAPAVPQAAFDIGDKAEAGFSYPIRWTGEANHVDRLGFVAPGADRAAASSSFGVIGGTDAAPRNPATRTAPATPGRYDLLLVSSRGGVIARQAIDVVEPSMGFEAIGSVEPGSRVLFTFRGPERVGERIVIARPDDPAATRVFEWSYALHKNGRTRLAVPAEPGEYEVRYLNSRSTEILFARRFGIGVPFEDTDATTLESLAAKATAATRADPQQDDLPLVSASFRLPANTPAFALVWTARPLDSDRAGAALTLDARDAVGRGEFEPGRYAVRAVGAEGVEFSARVEIVPGQDNRFELTRVQD